MQSEKHQKEPVAALNVVILYDDFDHGHRHEPVGRHGGRAKGAYDGRSTWPLSRRCLVLWPRKRSPWPRQITGCFPILRLPGEDRMREGA